MGVDIKYSEHAKENIKERKVERIWIEETMQFPDKITKDGNKVYATKKLNGVTLRVVYVKEKHIKVITFYWI